MRRKVWVALVSGCALCCAGCAEDASDDAGRDGGPDAVADVSGNDAGTDLGADTTETGLSDVGPGETGGGDTGPADTGAGDTGAGDTGVADTGVADTGVGDTGSGPKDSGADADGGAWSSTAHVHIYISNTCGVTTDPVSFDVPVGKTVKVSWHNHSVDYRADVWASYGGGYLALEKGATWAETYEHCFVKSTHAEWVDVTPEGSPSACGKQRVYFYCHG